MQESDRDRFDNIHYLRRGTALQRRIYGLLEREALLAKLQAFQPFLAGTIPLDISIPSSDIDILCCANDLERFQKFVGDTFGDQHLFACSSLLVNGEPTVLATFKLDGFAVEIFAQRKPVKQQNGYLHLVKEWEILTAQGQEFKQKIIALKRAGMKTEPAFAHLLNIEGDPYEGLLNYTVV
ncbi:DUF4269 domain-containing protein [Sphingobacterium deserti]|uniref:Uncharacterized protein n=1 Tax=Sphingobacterium deserti TaxID=1229276 RepID=A0A0B8T010_9SPHI|nr:DUF4269 domain-containing protein [Sphingobacterium deserti]KGE13642.1 hypothetical protein DI53_2563 [Sphingobacterium deserti]